MKLNKTKAFLNKFNISEITSYMIFLSFCAVLFRPKILNSITIILSILLLVVNQISNGKGINRIGWKNILFLGIPFFLTAIGLFWTNDLSKGFDFLIRSTPLIVIPFAYLSFDRNSIMRAYNLVVKYFPIFTFIVFYLFVFLGLFLIFKGYGNYLFYSNFAEITGIHTTQMGLIINIAILFLINQKNQFDKIKFYTLFLGLFILLVMVSSKISFVVFGVTFWYFLSVKIKTYYLRFIYFTGAVLFLFFLFKVTLEVRVIDKKLENEEHLRTIDLVKEFVENDIKPRLDLWKSNIEVIENNPMIGFGTNASEDRRIQKYRDKNLKSAVEFKYNAHNQYVEILYYYGVIGLVLFLLHCFYLVNKIVRQKQWFLLVLYLSFLIHFISESILMRSLGIILYSFIVAFIALKLESNVDED